MRKWGKGILLLSVITIVLAAVIGGLILLGPPSQERMRRIDARRVADLRAVTSAVNLYWTRHKSLPPSLEELSKEPGVYVKLLDPETDRSYEYKALNSKSYELCARFEHDTAEEKVTHYKDFWSHGTGRQCFHLEVRKVRQ